MPEYAVPMAQPLAEPEDQTGVLVALCGLGALLGFGATRYRAALAVAGKRALPVRSFPGSGFFFRRCRSAVRVSR